MDELIRATSSTLTLYGGVRLLTKDATFDDLAQADYWEIYQRLRGWDASTGEYSVSLSQFAKLMGEYPSKAEWSRWDRGEIEARRPIRNALRAADNRALLPETVAQTIAQHVNPDATVFYIGEGEVAEAVLLLGDITAYKGLEDVEGYEDTTEAPSVEVRPRTKSQRKYFRPCLPVEAAEYVGNDDVWELIQLGKQAKRQMEGWL